MAIIKKRNEHMQSRLLLEDDEPVELPPAAVDETRIALQFETFKPYLPELVAALRAGTLAEPVPVMTDGSTFAIHGATRTFWVKLWHSSAERTTIDRAQVLSCLPSTRGVRIVASMEDEDYEDDEFADDDDFAGDETANDESSIDEPEDDERDAAR